MLVAENLRVTLEMRLWTGSLRVKRTKKEKKFFFNSETFPLFSGDGKAERMRSKLQLLTSTPEEKITTDYMLTWKTHKDMYYENTMKNT